MTTRHTCAACGHEDNATELYAQAGPTGAGWYCRNHNGCQRRRNDNRKVTTTMNFGTYTEPEPSTGDTYKPQDNYGNSVIVKVLEIDEKKITGNSPNGAPAVFCDLYDLNRKEAFRNVMMMTGAIVDGFRPHLGRDPIVIRWEKTRAASGRDYARPVPAVEAAIEAARAVYANGDPFVNLTTIESETPF